jgi:hypothetical protein
MVRMMILRVEEVKYHGTCSVELYSAVGFVRTVGDADMAVLQK